MMARAREIEELECDQSFALAAAWVIEVRAKEMIDQAAGVLDLDQIERVHDMRVATRRLQAAMEVFRKCFPRKRRRAALKQVRALADALGERRDPDVSIERLEGFADQMESGENRGIASLVEHFKLEQEVADQRLPVRDREATAASPPSSPSWPPPHATSPPGRPAPVKAGKVRGSTRPHRCARTGRGSSADGWRDALLRRCSLRTWVCHRPARHEDRRQAASLRARDHRAMLRTGGGQGQEGRQGPAVSAGDIPACA